MATLELSFESGEDSLSVRRFAVREALSSLFAVSVEARSPHDDIDFASIIGKFAALRVAAGPMHPTREARRWAGVCRHMEQVQAEETGLSTYQLDIVPVLWLLTQRCNHRLFQHLSIPEITGALLAEWRIEATWKVDRAAYPKLELRTQYGESDYAFLSRLLEEAGITFYFSEGEDERGPQLVFHEKPQGEDVRDGGALLYLDNPSGATGAEHLTKVTLTQDLRPGRYTIRDFDFRRGPESPLFGVAQGAPPPEGGLEQYHYRPGAFLVEGGSPSDTPVADNQGVARHDDRAGRSLAERSLEALRASRRVVLFKTNVLDLAPGVLFTLGRHPRAELSPDKKLLVTELSIEGTAEGEWGISGRAVFAAEAYRPPQVTPKPQLHGVQSALVVGPKGEEIHTDEFGRVRVQFHWDREGKYDDRSSCWMRVSQGWAGSGFGMIAIPRVGQEVLVGFLEGDPDQPVVVGRLYNNTARVPYKLPENKAVSGWKSDSSPGSGGFNEIRFEDSKGRELVHLQAERDLTKLVKVDEVETTGRDRVIRVGRRLELTNGEASIVLDGPHVRIEAKGQIFVEGGPVGVVEAEEPEEEVAPEVDAEGRENYSEGVDMKGSVEFRKSAREALDRLKATRTGRGLLRKIAKTGRVVTIIETGQSNGICKPDSVKDASMATDRSPGKGCNSTVAFNPAFKPGGAPNEVVLGHMLGRARLNGLGVRESTFEHADGHSSIQKRQLYEVMRTENDMRRDLHLPYRAHY